MKNLNHMIMGGTYPYKEYRDAMQGSSLSEVLKLNDRLLGLDSIDNTSTMSSFIKSISGLDKISRQFSDKLSISEELAKQSYDAIGMLGNEALKEQEKRLRLDFIDNTAIHSFMKSISGLDKISKQFSDKLSISEELAKQSYEAIGFGTLSNMNERYKYKELLAIDSPSSAKTFANLSDLSSFKMGDMLKTYEKIFGTNPSRGIGLSFEDIDDFNLSNILREQYPEISSIINGLDSYNHNRLMNKNISLEINIIKRGEVKWLTPEMISAFIYFLISMMVTLYLNNQSKEDKVQVLQQQEYKIKKLASYNNDKYFQAIRTVNVRNKPTIKNSKVLGKMQKNFRVLLLQSKSQWIEIEYFDKDKQCTITGWVYKRNMKRIKK